MKNGADLVGGGRHPVLALDPGWAVHDNALQRHSFAVHACDP